MAAKHKRSSSFFDSGIYDDLTSFSELETRIAHLPVSKDKGDAFEVFAEAYLATQRITQSKQVWPFESLPPSIAQDLQLDTGRDMGVDGVIETTLGQFAAYQIKFRSGRPKLTWDELSTFMGLTDQVSQRILFTNCDDFPKLMNDRTGFFCIRGSDLDRLEQSDFDTIRQWLASGIIKSSRKHPLPHQSEALDAILPSLDEQDRATAVMACGTGKTLVALWVAERMQCQSVVVLLPSLSLVRQTLHEWLKETAWQKLTYLCVCSDSSVSRGADSVLVQQSDLDFSVTTNENQICQFLDADFAGVRIVFSTYQSAHLLGAAMEGHAPFDLGIFDEAHKTTGRQGAKFGFALSDDNLAIHKRLFLTATPRHYNINKKNKEGDAALVYSMDATDIYGPMAFTLSFAKAAEQGIICDYKVVISIVTSEMLGRELIQHSEVLVEGNAVKAQQVANQLSISQAVEKYGVNRIFSFHASVASARSFTSDTGEGIGSHLQDFDAFHVNGAMPTSKRAHVMKAFADAERALISNARCLTEGVDVPAVDMVAFMSPKKSKVDIVQATGRAMRKSPGKTVGYVLIPLFLEMEQNETVEEALERTGLEDIWNVLQAMQEQDEALVDVIRQMREDKGRTGRFDDVCLREKIEILGETLPLESLQSSISAACVDRLGVAWDERFGELNEYKGRFGHCNVPNDWAENPMFGRWVTQQRSDKVQGVISQYRIDLLDGIGFVWTPLDESWNAMFDAFVDHKNKSGDGLARTINNRSLAKWVGRQRSEKRRGSIAEERLNRLESIGFIWDIAEAAWEDMFNDLSCFKEEYGHCNVSRRFKDNPQLASWVNNQRNQRKKRLLTDSQIERFNNLGFEWNPKADFWDKMFQKLVEYKESHGHCNIPDGWKQNKQLAAWVQNQRQERKKGELAQNKIDRLQSVGFVWSMYDSFWEDMFQLLIKYKKSHGNCNVSQRWADNPQLGNWVSSQRSAFKRRTLSSEHIRRLELIGFVWNALDAKWDEMFSALSAFKETYGSCNISSNSDEYRDLAQWVRIQRERRKQLKMDKERIRALDSIGFIWNPLNAKWEEMFSELSAYKAVYGDMRIPANNSEYQGLRRWVGTQRTRKKQNKVDSERIRKLDSIGFEW